MVKKLVLHEIIVYAFIDQMNVVHEDADHLLVGLFEDDHRVFQNELGTIDFAEFVFLKFGIHLFIKK